MNATTKLDSVAIGATLVLLGYGISACGGSNPAAPGNNAPVGATVILTANGLSDAAPRVGLGSVVRFTNNDSVAHEIFTTPHNQHTDCPALNQIGVLQPGQSRDSGALNAQRGCGFHDHRNPDDFSFRGQVIVGFDAGVPDPGAPAY